MLQKVKLNFPNNRFWLTLYINIPLPLYAPLLSKNKVTSRLLGRREIQKTKMNKTKVFSVKLHLDLKLWSNQNKVYFMLISHLDKCWKLFEGFWAWQEAWIWYVVLILVNELYPKIWTPPRGHFFWFQKFFGPNFFRPKFFFD